MEELEVTDEELEEMLAEDEMEYENLTYENLTDELISELRPKLERIIILSQKVIDSMDDLNDEELS
jgi:hypothetical protein